MIALFAGAEVGSNLRLLNAAGVTNVSAQWWGYRRRGIPAKKKFLVADRVSEHINLFIESGASRADVSEEAGRSLPAISAQYWKFIGDNHSRLSGFTEFDSDVLDPKIIHEARLEHLGDEKFWPVWKPEQGFHNLTWLAENFPNIAMSGNTMKSMLSLPTRMGFHTRESGTRFHALGTADAALLRRVPVETYTTLWWLEPMKSSRLAVWDGARIRSYGRESLVSALPKYSLAAELAGLDVEEYLMGNTVTLTQLAIWSIQQQEAFVNGNPIEEDTTLTEASQEEDTTLTEAAQEEDTDLTGLTDPVDLVDPPEEDAVLTDPAEDAPEVAPDPISDITVLDPEVNTMDLSKRTPNDSPPAPRPRAKPRNVGDLTVLPVFGLSSKEVFDVEGGEAGVIRDVPVVRSVATSLRQCESCFVSVNCPAFTPGSMCSFNLPVELKTKDQLKSLINALLEMQGQRIAFSRFAEELNGGYPDPNTGMELDRFFRLLKATRDLEDTRDRVRVTMERESSGGILSAIFGEKAAVLSDLPNGGIDRSGTNKIIQSALET